jgi:uncharacterized repeat protein (TIGR01451 family)
MKKQLLSMLCPAFLLLSSVGFSQCDVSQQCNYTFHLLDIFGDGWNGNTMNVYQNGNFVALLELPDGSQSDVVVPLCDGQPFQLSWNTGGTFTSEVGVSIVNSFGQTLYNKFPNSGTPGTVLYNDIVNCTTPACVAPINISVSVLVNEAVTIGWTDGNSASQWEYIVLPAGSPAPSASSSGTLTSESTLNLNSLQMGFLYDFYVRSICNESTSSGWSSATSINTLCYTPLNVSIQQLGQNSVEVSWYNPGNAAQWEVILQPSTEPTPGADAAGIIANTTSIVLDDIVIGTENNFYVRALCSANSVSEWSQPGTYTTLCSQPYNISVDALQTTSPIFSWYASGPVSQWEVIIQPAGAEAPTPDSVGTIQSEAVNNASGLTIGTPYTFYVRAVCGPGVTSEWVSLNFQLYVSLPPLSVNQSDYTPSQLISEVLVNNPCIAITNVTSSSGANFGGENSIGYFTNTNSTFPISSGIVLSTGNVANVPGPNISTLSDGGSGWNGDSELEALIYQTTGIQMSSQNATKLEFDFTTAQEFMSFNFLFASDEYGTFQCTFADAFAFLLTDLETNVTTNIAVVPGTNDPISVVTIRDVANNPGCPSANPGFFASYSDSEINGAYTSATNFNGHTALMTASSPIQPNHPYHIKLVVADRADQAFDSAVFIEGGSFTAGPPECTDKIQLVAFVDENTNGIKDNNEVNFTYGSFSSQQNNAGDTTSITSPFGTYTIYDSDPANTYDLGYGINPEYAPYFALASTSYDDVSIPSGSGTQVLYFPVTITQGYNDVTVAIVPVSQPVPGSNYTNKIVYRNLGIAPTSGTVSFTKDPLTAVSVVSPNGSVSNSTGFTYTFSNLQPYESRTLNVTMSVPAIPTVAIGNLLNVSASVTAPANDVNLSNNTAASAQIIVASYDPNDKMESHGEKIQFNQFAQTEDLVYTIRFQNTGTANAVNVRLEDVLDPQIDPESIRMISASHNYVLQRVGENLVWKLDYIQLPPALQNEALSTGYVTFSVRLKPGFNVGDIIPNLAKIYFDSNPAIETNTFNTEFVELLSNVGFDEGNLIMFPNPANNQVSISVQNTNEVLESVTIFDVVGKAVKKVSGISAAQANLDISALSNGMYIVEIHTENDVVQIRKLVIQ